MYCLRGAHSQVYPEGGSKEIKEESCHRSRQVLSHIQHAGVECSIEVRMFTSVTVCVTVCV